MFFSDNTENKLNFLYEFNMQLYIESMVLFLYE